MTDDFYCENVLSGKIEVDVVHETGNVLAYRHTRPFWETHIVVIPKRHISSLLTLEPGDDALLLELFSVIRSVAEKVVGQSGAHGSSRIWENTRTRNTCISTSVPASN